MGLTLEELRAEFGDDLGDGRAYLNNADATTTIEVPPARIRDVIRWLRDTRGFQQVSALTATDELLPDDSEPERTALRPNAKARYRVVYQARAVEVDPQQLRLVVWLEDGARLDSITDLFPGVDWYEREVYDMFGIVFEGHPDLKRILMPDGYDGHPLQKTFPLRGTSPARLYQQWDLERKLDAPDTDAQEAPR